MLSDEEKAEEYTIKITDELRRKGVLSNEEISQRYAGISQGVLYGLAEGRKEKQVIIDTQTVQIESRDVYLAEKENIILKQQSEIEQLKAENKIILEDNDDLNKWIDELREQIEYLNSEILKMRCTGNCNNANSEKCSSYCYDCKHYEYND